MRLVRNHRVTDGENVILLAKQLDQAHAEKARAWQIVSWMLRDLGEFNTGIRTDRFQSRGEIIEALEAIQRHYYSRDIRGALCDVVPPQTPGTCPACRVSVPVGVVHECEGGAA